MQAGQHLQTILLVGAGGFIGANLRHWLSVWIATQVGTDFPWWTMLVNFSGSLLLAVFITWSARQIAFITPQMRLLVATGFFGAYTTYSTFANESVALFQQGNWRGGLGYILGTNLICLAGVLAGVWVGSRL